MFFNYGFPPDWSSMKKLIWLRGSGASGGLLPWTEFTGNPLQFDAPKAHALKSCVVSIEPIQSGSGDPSPDNVRPISGWNSARLYRTGKNLLSPTLYKGVQYNPSNGAVFDTTLASPQFTDNGDGTFSLSTSATWKYFCMLLPCHGMPRFHLKIKGESTGQFGRTTGFLDKDLKVISASNNTSASWTFEENYTPSSNPQRAYFYIVLTNRATASATITITEPQIELSEEGVASAYEPYSGSSLTLPFGQTVYGGTASYNGDGTWTVTVTEVAKHASGLTWANNASYANTFNGDGFTNRKLKINGSNANGCYCDTYKWYTSGEVGASSGGIALANASSGSLAAMSRIYIKDTNFADKNEFVASFTEHDPLIVCPLATPTTFTITTAELFDALQGRNVMWTDCKNLTVEAKGTAVTP